MKVLHKELVFSQICWTFFFNFLLASTFEHLINSIWIKIHISMVTFVTINTYTGHWECVIYLPIPIAIQPLYSIVLTLV